MSGRDIPADLGHSHALSKNAFVGRFLHVTERTDDMHSDKFPRYYL